MFKRGSKFHILLLIIFFSLNTIYPVRDDDLQELKRQQI